MKILDQQEKTVKQLRSDGFEVESKVVGRSGACYDLIAERDDQTIVFEFKHQSQLNSDFGAISQLRQSARQDGYRDFRLVVVPDENYPTIEISGLDQALLLWLQQHPEVKVGTALEKCDVVFLRVGQAYVTSLANTPGGSGLNAEGIAVVEFFAPSIRPEVVWDCPLVFNAHLDSVGQLKSARVTALDLGSISDDLQEYLDQYLWQLSETAK